MILDSYFAIACVLLLAALVAVIAFAAYEINCWAKAAREAVGGWRQSSEIAKRWREAYEARDAQLAEARTRIDTLEGELTAADIALSQARKNDHRDAKGRFARAA